MLPLLFTELIESMKKITPEELAAAKNDLNPPEEGEKVVGTLSEPLQRFWTAIQIRWNAVKAKIRDNDERLETLPEAELKGICGEVFRERELVEIFRSFFREAVRREHPELDGKSIVLCADWRVASYESQPGPQIIMRLMI